MSDTYLRILAPIAVTEAMMTATNVAEDDAAAWMSGTTYAKGDRVLVLATHKVYESVAGGNLGNDPTVDDGTWWIEVYATKPWRAFDSVMSAPLSQSGTITYTIEPDTLIRAVALVAPRALYATVAIKNSGGTTLATQTIYLADYSEMVDAMSMVTVEPGMRAFAIFEGMICQPGNRIEITIGDGTGTAEISEILIGDILTVGRALMGADIATDDLSRVEEDDFGNVAVVRRGYRDRTGFPVLVNRVDIPRLRRRLRELRAVPILAYVTTEAADDGTTVYGRYEKLEMLISGPATADMELRIQGVVYAA